jgi:hypothetical protein
LDHRAPLMAAHLPYRVLANHATDADRRAAARIQRLAFWLDDRFRIPGTRRRVGLDGLIGFVPGLGDVATTLVSPYIVVEAWRIGVPVTKLGRMGLNVGVDAMLGAVPLLGDLFDMAWKANQRNVRLLLDHLEAAPPHRAPGLLRIQHPPVRTT